MPSSTSSSDGAGVLGRPILELPLPLDGRHAPVPVPAPAPAPSANPDFEAARGLDRPVPALPWARMMVAAALGLVVAMTAWEFGMRQLGLRAGDLDDGRDYWTVERRKVDTGPRDQVVLVGDSRMLFDTDLAAWQRVAGRRPIQLALPATNAGGFLHDLAEDEHFAGLVVFGTAEVSFFRNADGGSEDVLRYFHAETPAQRVGHRLYEGLSRAFAFLDSNYTLFTLLERREWHEREGVDGPMKEVWKLSESVDARQTWLWERLERDPVLRDQARNVWLSVYRPELVQADVVDKTIAQAKADVDRIRARGGEVVFVRPPSAGPIRERERTRCPRPLVWDRLLHDTGTYGVHFEDYPGMQNLSVPDWSHLSRASSTPFTEAYVRAIVDHVPWLRAHPPAAP